ncbi:MAG: carboxypeptidase regulatory-like domain-containing protein [Candidatus Omnitrophica bacterium]|nr:carboxypeptidase regulatory-like domain-containing protein [Candidatus Omnitrophota bacterium]
MSVVVFLGGAVSSTAQGAKDPGPSPLSPEDHPGPRVRLVSPADGQFISGVCRIAIEVASSHAIDLVNVYRGGRLLGSDFEPPYEVSWDTRSEADGPHTLAAYAIGQDFTEANSPKITVMLDNTPPWVALITPRDSAKVAGVATLEADASDVIGVNAVTFLLDGDALGQAKVPPYRLTWESSAVPTGNHTLQALATDRAGNHAISDPVTILVANTNTRPALEPPGPQTVPEGTRLSIRLKATDPDAPRDTLTFRALHLPPWASLNPQTGELSGAPGYQEASPGDPVQEYPDVEVEVCDPEPLCDRKPMVIHVLHVNRPPVMEPVGNQVVDEGKPLTVQLIANDPEGDPLACKAQLLPPWLTFDVSTCAARGVPTDRITVLTKPETVYPGVFFEVCDPEGLCAGETVTITVANVGDQPPVLTMPERLAVDEGRPMAFTVSAEDPEGQPVTLAMEPVPEGATFRDDERGTGTFTWTPRFDQSGAYEPTVTAAAGETKGRQPVRITVREVSLAISGTVRDIGGRPVPKATVHIRTSKATVQEATTDGQGRYVAKDLPAGIYTVKPTYQLERTFSPTARKFSGVAFSPASHKVTLRDRDQTGFDFIATFP